jgi:hypothetical protein
MLGALLLLWGMIIAALIRFAIGRRGEGGALTLAYFLGLSLIHVPGALAFLPGVAFRGYYSLSERAMTEAGFSITVIGMAAFLIGAILARLAARRRVDSKAIFSHQRSAAFERKGRRGIAIGIVAYFVLMPLSHGIASLTAAVAPFAVLLIVGLWLLLYGALDRRDRRRTWIVLGSLPLLPLATLMTGGFVSYGVSWMLSVLAFLFTITPRRSRFYAAAPLAVFLGLSLFVAYMGQRTSIRELIWQQEAGVGERIDRVARIVTDFHPFDPTSPADLAVLDERLNQNALVDLAAARIDGGLVQLAHGATVPVWALVPRAIWPEKPYVGGGLDVVARFTGIHFWPGTSVGAGQVFEFYVNFGFAGVVTGFLILGFVLRWLDHGIMRALARDDFRAFLLRAMPGLTALQPGGNLLEIIVAVFAAITVAYVLTGIRALRVARAAPQARQTA